MNTPTQRRAAWFQLSLRSLFALVLVAAAFFAGWSVADREAGRAIGDAKQAADTAGREEEQTRQQIDGELARERHWHTIPCHPGCFPAGTLVRVPEGTAPIESIGPGRRVTTVGADGQLSSAEVASVFTTRNGLLTVATDRGNLATTQTQPLCLASGELKAAGELKPGDVLWQWDGRQRRAATVRSVTSSRVAQVFNLVLGEPQVFIAGGFLARSKPPGAPDTASTADASALR